MCIIYCSLSAMAESEPKYNPDVASGSIRIVFFSTALLAWQEWDFSATKLVIVLINSK